jgi:hypothetical protein
MNQDVIQQYINERKRFDEEERIARNLQKARIEELEQKAAQFVERCRIESNQRGKDEEKQMFCKQKEVEERKLRQQNIEEEEALRPLRRKRKGNGKFDKLRKERNWR